MRIAFLCNNLEPGRDGVGDYTRSLAAQCIRQGHKCKLVSLNDRRAIIGDEIQEHDGVSIESTRCAGSLPRAKRISMARAAIAAFDPDCISLQFVPYGFHPKGLPWNLVRDLKTLIANRPLQIMFHELWIGFGKKASLKDRMIGALQRRCILRLIHALKPETVNTSNATYISMLKEHGVTALELPLFGNIPLFDAGRSPALSPRLVAAGVPADFSIRKDWWLGMFFGTLHPEWAPEPFMGILQRTARKAGKRVCLFSAGRLGASGEFLWESVRRDYGSEILFVKLGEQTCEGISTLFQVADFGVAASPLDLIGKSSTVASMIDHGLPYVVTRGAERAGDKTITTIVAEPLLHLCDDALEQKLITGLPKRIPYPRLPEICARFVEGLPVRS